MADKTQNDRFETKGEEVVKIIHEVNSASYTLRLTAHKDEMELRCSFKPGSDCSKFSEEVFHSILVDAGVSAEIDNDAVSKLCYQASRKRTQKNILIAVGTKPVKGDDQRIDFLAKSSSENVIKFEEFDEKKDYHNLNLFDNVEQGELIAEVFWATDGTPGVNGLGQHVEAMRGLMFTRERRAGRNVTMSEDGSQFFADVSGRILYDQFRGVIEVSDTYEIRGDVGYKTGNIDFVGHVIVNGDVSDTYNIKAGLNIRINGHVGNSRIECGGDIDLIGVDGKNEARVLCAGNFKGRYVHEAGIEAQGNIEIVKEAVNANLHSEKVIYATKGSIIGGDSIALCGIEVNEVGSDAQVPTKLTAGISYILRQRVALLKADIVVLEDSITKIEKKINPFVTNPRNLLSLNDDGRKQIQELTEEFKETVSKKEQMAIELKEIRDSSREDANPMINILAAVNPRVSLNLGTSCEVTTQRKVLHCTVLENSLKGGLRFTSVYRLSSKAKDIESEIADRESQQI